MERRLKQIIILLQREIKYAALSGDTAHVGEINRALRALLRVQLKLKRNWGNNDV